ncbi:DUF6907 domain-containing protein [Streptomyces sp. NPDC003343]
MTRTVTLETIDHGPVTFDEPPWCVGHHGQHEIYRTDITHNSVRVKSGTTTETKGWLPMLTVHISWRPFRELVPVISLVLDAEGDFQAEDGRRISEGLVTAAMRIEAVAAEAIRLRDGIA